MLPCGVSSIYNCKKTKRLSSEICLDVIDSQVFPLERTHFVFCWKSFDYSSASVIQYNHRNKGTFIMIKEVNGKKYIFMSSYNSDCHKCVAYRNNELCESLGECNGGYFSEVDDRTPEVTNTQEQPTLRDQFAMAIITNDRMYTLRGDAQELRDDYAQRVFALADAMMKARAK
jgi:hypothetical protein